MHELKEHYTLRDRHATNMQQARAGRRDDGVSSRCTSKRTDRGTGVLVEYDSTEKIFTHPSDEADRGLRDGTVRLMRLSFTEELAQLEASLQEEGDLVLRAFAVVAERTRPGRRRARRRG